MTNGRTLGPGYNTGVVTEILSIVKEKQAYYIYFEVCGGGILAKVCYRIDTEYQETDYTTHRFVTISIRCIIKHHTLWTISRGRLK
jgi:hypothetical protein